MNDVSDIRDALAQLDRRLGEIRQHVGRLLQDDQPPAGAPAADPTETVPEPSAEPVREPSAEPVREPSAETPEPPAGHAPEPPAGHAPEPPAGPPSPPPAEPSSPPAPAVGDRDLADAQIQTLRQLRDELLRGTRELVHSYERQLDALEATFASTPPPAPMFDGTLNLVVTNVAGVAALADVEAAVRRLDGVERAVVTRYAEQEASIELHLARPLELVGLLSEALPRTAAIRTVTGDEIVVELEAPGATGDGPAGTGPRSADR